MTVTELHSSLLSESDRSHAAETLKELEASGALPEAVKEPVLRLLRLASQGRGAAVVATGEDLTTTQAAELLGVSRPFLTKMIDNGHIPSHRTGRDRRIAAADVVAFLSERESLKQRQREAAATYATRRAERLAAITGLSVKEATELGFGQGRSLDHGAQIGEGASP